MADRFRLSKSKYMSGLQCPRLLWWTIHEPDAAELEPDEAKRALFAQGHQVGELAQERFPGGVPIDVPYTDRPALFRATREAMASGAPAIFEAACEHESVLVRVDVLEREGDGWRLVEVKQSTKVKPEHIPDMAVQKWVLQGAGVGVTGTELMHLDRACRYPDLSNLFLREDCTAEVDAMLPEVGHRIESMKRMLRDDLPMVEPGAHCNDPYECVFKNRCWNDVPEHSLWSMHRLGADKRESLQEAGYETIGDLPGTVGLSEVQERQRRAVKDNRIVVESGLGHVLDTLVYPVAYLDFETVWPAVPVWDGMAPYDQAPVQVSVHVEGEDGGLRHHEWLASGADDPREEMARRILEFTGGTGSVVVYNAAFERKCIRDLAGRFGRYATGLKQVEDRLWDLLPVVRNHVYHPEFLGSFSIKAVLPAMVSGKGYEELAIADGNAASRVLKDLLLNGDAMTPEDRERLRTDLLAYCRMDTRAMVELVHRLKELVD